MEQMIPLKEAAHILQIDEKTLYFRVWQRKKRDKSISLHSGQRKTVFVNLEKLNYPTSSETIELGNLYFDVKEEWGLGFYSEVAKRSGVSYQTVYNYFLKFSFKRKTTLIRYRNVLNEMKEELCLE